MAYIGSWKVDDLLTFACNTHTVTTGAATDSDSVPSYRVYEDETGTAILSGSMAKLDDANTTGFYSEQITLSAANGFEKGKCYTVYISATVNSVIGTMHHTFQMEAEVDSNSVSNIGANVITATSINADAITAAKIADGAIDAATFAAGAITATVIATDAIDNDAIAANAITEIQSGLALQTSVDDLEGRLTATRAGYLDNLSAGAVALQSSVDSLEAGVIVTTNNDKTGYGLSAGAIQAIWDALTSALTTVGSIGKRIADNLDATISSRLATGGYTAPLDAAGVRTAVGLASANLDTQIGDLPTNAELATSQAAADDATLSAIAALNNLSAAQVNSEVLDVLNVDTFAEPTGAPAATATLAGKIGRIYQIMRNKITVTGSAKTFFNDSGTSLWSKSLSDDATTYTEDEGA